MVHHNRRNHRNKEKYTNRKKQKEDFYIFDSANPLKEITDPIVKMAVGIGKLAMKIPEFIMLLVKIILWLFDVVIWFFKDFLNPMVWIEDVIQGVFVGFQIMLASIMDACISFVREIVNRILGPMANGLWGDDYPNKDKSKCYKMPDCSVPYPVLLGTIILPPFGVFMELGLKGWLNILICAMLTLAYYVPGLVYALILLYC